MPAVRPQQLDDHRKLGQRQVLELVDDDPVAGQARGQAARFESRGGFFRRDQFRERLLDGVLVQGPQQPEQRAGAGAADPPFVPALAHVRRFLQPHQPAVTFAVGLARGAAAQQAPAQLGIQRLLLLVPWSADLAPRRSCGLANPFQALRRVGGLDVAADQLADQRPEVERLDVDAGRRERVQVLFGVACERLRPGQVEHPLAVPGLDGAPQSRRLAAPRPTPQHPHRGITNPQVVSPVCRASVDRRRRVCRPALVAQAPITSRCRATGRPRASRSCWRRTVPTTQETVAPSRAAAATSGVTRTVFP